MKNTPGQGRRFPANVRRSKLKFVSPLYIFLPRKTKLDRRITLNLNWYRNAKFFEANQAKQVYTSYMAANYSKVIQFEGPIHIKYKWYFHRQCDLGNFRSIVEKFFLDFLVEKGWIGDDNCRFVVSDESMFMGFDRENPRGEIEVIQKGGQNG
jgi:hypothetical protein